MSIRIDNAEECSGKAQAGTICLRNTILGKFDGSRDMGIYNCRDVRGGSAMSIHSEGRAVDIGPKDKAQGDKIADWVVANARRYQIQRVIWYRRIWDSSRGWRDYTGLSPHTDHLHIEQNWTGALTCATSSLGFLQAGGSWWQYALMGSLALGVVVQAIRKRRS